MNKVMLFGRLGRDPEVRATNENGGKVCNLSLATSERYKDRAGEWQEATEWHRVVAFGRTAETCEQYLTKGREVLVEGRLRTREWEDQSGAKRHSTEVVAANITFAGGSGGRAGGGNGEDRGGGNGRGRTVDLDDEIPF
jgi:single-strand DNA-binding protein